MIRTRLNRALFGRPRWAVLLLLVLGALVLVAGLAAGALGRPADGPRLSFQERSHDFGEVSYAQPVEHRFALTNTGSGPLELGDLRLEPVSPGG